MFDDFGDFELSVLCVSFKEEYLLHCGSSGGFGSEGILENKIDYTHKSCPKSMSNL
jgi:hypothetical protein